MKNLIRATLTALGAITFVFVLLGLLQYRRNAVVGVTDLGRQTKDPFEGLRDDDINDEDFKDLNERNTYPARPEDLAEQSSAVAVNTGDNEEVRSVAS